MVLGNELDHIGVHYIIAVSSFIQNPVTCPSIGLICSDIQGGQIFLMTERFSLCIFRYLYSYAKYIHIQQSMCFTFSLSVIYPYEYPVLSYAYHSVERLNRQLKQTKEIFTTLP